jgi:ATP-dependent Lhr-like helicase
VAGENESHGAAQFAQPGAVDLLRAAREAPESPWAVTLAATDPANPYGALMLWPEWPHLTPDPPTRATRSAGARVILVDGRLAAWIGRGDRQLLVSLPADEPDRSRVGRALALELVAIAERAPEGSRGWLIAEINGSPARPRPGGRVPHRRGLPADRDGAAASRQEPLRGIEDQNVSLKPAVPSNCGDGCTLPLSSTAAPNSPSAKK